MSKMKIRELRLDESWANDRKTAEQFTYLILNIVKLIFWTKTNMINYNTGIAPYFKIFFWTKAGLQYLIEFGKKREGFSY